MTIRKIVGVLAMAGCSTVALTSFSCDKSTSSSAGGGSGGGDSQVKLVGAGATFPAPLYTQWFKNYHDAHPNAIVEYQGIGSGGGIKQFTAGTTDFGASDVGMTDEQMGQVQGGVVLLPMTAGAIVLSYNIEGVTSLKLNREAYAGIFMGEIKKWNDPKIAETNPGVNLPGADINVVHRADGSGTTGVFTKHLSAVSEKWKNGPGQGVTVNWPAGVGGKGNDGVTALIHQTPGSIGYVEYGYALSNKLPMAELQNKAGKMVAANPDTAASSLAAVQLLADLRAFLPDPDGDTSYPIVTYTWMLVHPKYDDAAKGKALKDVINYGLTDGQKLAPGLGYIPLPAPVVEKVKAAVDAIKAGS